MKNELQPIENIEAFQKNIHQWFQENKREMPWRRNPLPYYIWVSEIMLQQTRVDTVIPYFHRFIEKYPDVEALSKAKEEELLKLWEGLGYYNRARNLKIAAEEIMTKHQGALPKTYEALRELKGIGEYTAGAIASEAFGEKEIAVDGNVFRVMARLMGCKEDLKNTQVMKELKKEVRRLLPEKEVGDFNQGLIELGALICLPNGTPKCWQCPVKKVCTAYKEDLQLEIPKKTQKKKRREEEKTVLIFRHGKTFGLRKREEGKLLAGLYEFYHEEGHLSFEEALAYVEEMGLKVKSLVALKEKKFLFTHITWQLKAYMVDLASPMEGLLFVSKEEIIRTYSLATAFRDYFETICLMEEAREEKER